MRRWIEAPFAPGRTSIARGLIGLFVAPTVAFVLVPLPLAFFILSGDWGGERSNPDPLPGLELIGIGFVVALFATLILGGATWVVLRLTRRESGAAYTLAGAAGGLLFMLRYGSFGFSLFQPDRLIALGFCAFTGALVAFAFWLIAREPAGPPPEAA